MVAVAKVALRQRETLAAVRARDGVLVLVTLMWPDEVRVPDFEFLEEDVEVRSQELKMAASLIDSMTVDFDPSQYSDQYREALEELVEAKVEGHEVTALPPPPEKPVTSLADALRASLARRVGRGNRPGRPVSATRAQAGAPAQRLTLIAAPRVIPAPAGHRRAGARLRSGRRRPHHRGRRRARRPVHPISGWPTACWSRAWWTCRSTATTGWISPTVTPTAGRSWHGGCRKPAQRRSCRRSSPLRSPSWPHRCVLPQNGGGSGDRGGA